MVKTLDATGDSTRAELFAYSRQYEFPEYVKQASEEVLRPAELPPTAYADPRTKQFACHTKAACWLSTLYFLNHRHEMNRKTASWIEQGLDKFASHYGILADVTKLRNKFAALHAAGNEALPDSAFAIVDVDSSGRKARRYPLRNAMEVKAAAAWFVEHRDAFVFADRQRIAENLLDKAAAFGVGLGEELDDMLEKQAGRGVYDPVEAATMIRNRAKLSRVHPEVKSRLEKLADAVETNPRLAEDLANTSQLAATIDDFDQRHGLVGRYSPSYPRPEDVLFCGSLKQASVFVKNACATLTGAIYDRRQFSNLSVAQVRQAFGPDIASAVTSGIRVDPEKMAEVAATFPLPDAALLDRLMAGIGQKPSHTKAGAVGLQAEDRKRLAAEYRYAASLPQVEALPAPSGIVGSRNIGE